MPNLYDKTNILGVGISAINLEDAVQVIANWIDNQEQHYITVCTVHTIMECHRNPELRRIVNKSGLATPDGMPLVWLNHFHGFRNTTRVYGPDLMLALCKSSVEKGYTHYFYGGGYGVAEKLAQGLKDRYPGLRVAGAYSPPFRDVDAMEESSIIDDINITNPDIIWVGLGTPKQDFWVARHCALLKAPVLIAVGAAFDFHTGRVRQAPKWMQQHGLEWLFRLSMEPRRLAYRYLKYNPLFIILMTLQLMRLKRYSIEN